MASEKTLREVCENLNITRRVVQGYEKAGLVHATGKISTGICCMMKKLRIELLEFASIKVWDFALKKLKC